MNIHPLLAAFLVAVLCIEMARFAMDLQYWREHRAEMKSDDTPEAKLVVSDSTKHENIQLTYPPMIDGVTLMNWLIYNHPLRERIWPTVVHDFYEVAKSVPKIASYFHSTNIEELEKHFHHALVIVTDKGVTTGMLRIMRTKHARVFNREGERITSEIYDDVIDALLKILAGAGVPQMAIDQLVVTVAPLKAEIVRP
jgi:hypothetical protein